MKLETALDLAIKKQEGGTGAGYTMQDGRVYPTYMENSEWDAFLAEMKNRYPKAFKDYDAGSGGELEEKSRFGKTMPPKMASYGSSSRMTYRLSRDVPGFRFECQCPTGIGGTANLDGFLEKNRTRIYVEAKCREPYGKEKSKISKAYKKLYDFITEKMGAELSCICSNVGEKDMDVTFLAGDLEIRHFDIKQMICHLLGVVRDAKADTSVKFLYLLHDPTALELGEARQSILEIYERTCRECAKIPMERLFAVISEFLGATLQPFSFALCNQDTYVTYLQEKIKET